MEPLVRPVTELDKEQPIGDEDLDVDKVVPLFIPSSFVESGLWPGPFATLRASGVALAWAVLLRDDAMRYVLHEMQRVWEGQGIDWKVRALQNLRQLSPDPVYTGALFRDSGETWLISLMHPDGLGPSRLLLAGQLESLFPQGYRVALPERSRGFAFASNLDLEDADTIDNLVQSCYWRGERPLSTGTFEPNDLLSAPSRGSTP